MQFFETFFLWSIFLKFCILQVLVMQLQYTQFLKNSIKQFLWNKFRVISQQLNL
jgi:hypothetical protein